LPQGFWPTCIGCEQTKRDSAKAYASQRDDTEMQVWVSEIHLRQRIGQLSRELEKAQPHKGHGVLAGEKTKAEALAEAGPTVPTAHRYEQLAGGKTEQGQEAALAAAETYFARYSPRTRCMRAANAEPHAIVRYDALLPTRFHEKKKGGSKPSPKSGAERVRPRSDRRSALSCSGPSRNRAGRGPAARYRGVPEPERTPDRARTRTLADRDRSPLPR
jgi:hypothetical protein